MSKGSIPLDMILVFVVFTVILSITVIIGHMLSSQMITGMAGSGLNTTPLNQTAETFKLFNTGIPFIFFSFMVIAIALAWYIRTTPIISFFMIMIIAAIGYVAQGVSNAFYEFASSPSVSSTANQYGYTVGLLNNFGVYILIIGLAIVLFYFIKPKSLDV